MADIMPTVPVEPEDSGSNKQASKRKDKVKRLTGQRKSDLRVLMGMAEGRRTLTWLMEETGPYRGSFATNALSMAYTEGQRRLGLVLTDAIADADPEGWVQMHLEILLKKEADHV